MTPGVHDIVAEKFEMRMSSKYREKLLEDITEEFRDLHDKDSLTADVEMALEKALEWKKRRAEKKVEYMDRKSELQELQEKWDLED